jgi:hypothetical protein
MTKVLEEGLDRVLTVQELKTVHWLSDTENETRGVILDLFKDLSKKAGERN